LNARAKASANAGWFRSCVAFNVDSGIGRAAEVAGEDSGEAAEPTATGDEGEDAGTGGRAGEYESKRGREEVNDGNALARCEPRVVAAAPTAAKDGEDCDGRVEGPG
jgi:hypothetical protein